MPPPPPPEINTSSPSSPVPFSWWFLTGGTAGSYYGGGRRRPPSRDEFLRRASERKAAHRWAQAQAEAAGAATARKKAAVAELEEEHGPLGLLGSGPKSSKLKAPVTRIPKREELMAQFGPGSGVRAGRGGRGAILAQRADEVAEKARAAQTSDRAQPPATVPVSNLPEAAPEAQEGANSHATAEEEDDPDDTCPPNPGENGTESGEHNVTRIQEDGNAEAVMVRAATGPEPEEEPEGSQPPETPPPNEGTEGAQNAPSTRDDAQT